MRCNHFIIFHKIVFYFTREPVQESFLVKNLTFYFEKFPVIITQKTYYQLFYIPTCKNLYYSNLLQHYVFLKKALLYHISKSSIFKKQDINTLNIYIYIYIYIYIIYSNTLNSSKKYVLYIIYVYIMS